LQSHAAAMQSLPPPFRTNTKRAGFHRRASSLSPRPRPYPLFFAQEYTPLAAAATASPTTSGVAQRANPGYHCIP